MADPILRDVSTPPDPVPYPEDTKSGAFALMLDMLRVEQSSTWILAAPELRPWLLMIWAKSWLQVPAGSLPDDDEIVAAMIGMPDTTFAVHRRTLMRGWTRCSDGRLYHRYLTSCVLRMIRERAKSWDRTQRSRAQTVDSTEDTVESRASNMESVVGLGLGTALPQKKGTKRQPVDKWWATLETMKAKGQTLGVISHPGEDREHYYQRILAEINKQKTVKTVD